MSPNPFPEFYTPHHKRGFRRSFSWRIFRIMAEFVEGFEFIADFKRAVAIFGSARTSPQNYSYKEAEKLAYSLSKKGFTIITGGGPGIMEAANKGAFEAGGESVGLDIELPKGQRVNEYVKKPVGFHYFFTRKVMFSFACSTYVFFPGGFGTLDEFFEMVTLIQTKKIPKRITVVAVGKNYWGGLFEWIEKTVYKKYQAIDQKDQKIFHLVDSSSEALEIILKEQKRA